jgi:uncharacterized cupin superfamily protein
MREKVFLKRSKTMTKFFVTKKISGIPLDPSLYNWDEKTITFSTNENGLVLDFTGIDGVTFNTGSKCTFNAGDFCTFKTGSYCTFNTGSYCTFKAGASCTFKTGHDCTFLTASNCTFATGHSCSFATGHSGTFKTGIVCTFKTGDSCAFKTGFNCTFITGSDCTFKTEHDCTFNAGYSCIFEVGDNCSLIRYDVKGVTKIPANNKIKLNGYGIDGYTAIEEKVEEKKEIPTCNGKVVEIDGKQYKLTQIKK